MGRVDRQGAVQSTRDFILLPSQCRSWNSIGPDGAAALAGHLEGLTNLQSLDLRYRYDEYLHHFSMMMYENDVCVRIP